MHEHIKLETRNSKHGIEGWHLLKREYEKEKSAPNLWWDNIKYVSLHREITVRRTNVFLRTQ